MSGPSAGVIGAIYIGQQVGLDKIITFDTVSYTHLAQKMETADGVCVGTAFKVDGKFQNQVDPERVVQFMQRVKEVRAAL